MIGGFGEASAGSPAAGCALTEPKTDFDSTYGVERRNRRHGRRRGVAGCAGDGFEPCSAVSGRRRPGHRRPPVTSRSRKPILTPPMESKARIVAMDGDEPPRVVPAAPALWAAADDARLESA